MGRHIKLNPVPLTNRVFAPFGDVIQTEGARHFGMNEGKLERYYDLASVEVGVESGGRPVISIASCKEITRLPLNIRLLERHPHGSQAIFPLFKQSIILVVAPIGDQISPDAIQAFYSNGSQGINFRPGIWHLPMIALQPGQSFMMVDRGGPNQNCDEFYFDEADQITLLRCSEFVET